MAFGVEALFDIDKDEDERRNDNKMKLRRMEIADCCVLQAVVILSGACASFLRFPPFHLLRVGCRREFSAVACHSFLAFIQCLVPCCQCGVVMCQALWFSVDSILVF